MCSRYSRLLLGTTAALALGFFIPACNKKKETASNTTEAKGPPAGSGGSKGGGMPGGNNKGEPGVPLPPGNGPVLGTGNAANKPITQNNLKQIGLAFHNLQDIYQAFPVAIADSTGKPGLSWRVAMLPFLEQDTLYKQFKLNEPWDSEHNKKLIALMPKTFAPPGIDTQGYTYYRSFSGPGAIMPPHTRPGTPGQVIPGNKIFSIPDGTANTLMVAEATEPVIWTKPDDLPFAAGVQRHPKLGDGVYKGGFYALMCDGSTRWIPGTIDVTNLCNAIQTNDGNIVNFP